MAVYLVILITVITLVIFTVTLPTCKYFEDMIKCTVPDSSPIYIYIYINHTVRSESFSITLESCSSLFDDPYTNIYEYKCDENTKTVTCLDSNDECDMFICQCDKTAAECFAQAPYNASNNHLSSSVCSSASKDISSFLITLTAFMVTLTPLYSNKMPCNK
uniref:Phospholipase A2-like central domain-containing protein n=1 Tax=Sinocyclocheilus grahami TaxID=75366 RepID=A0A672MSP8_SINGR